MLFRSNPLTVGQAVEARVLLGMILGDRGVARMAADADVVNDFHRAWLACSNHGDGWRAGPLFAAATAMQAAQHGADRVQQGDRPRSETGRRSAHRRPHSAYRRPGDADTSESDSTKRPRLSGQGRPERWEKLLTQPCGAIDVDSGMVVGVSGSGGADSDASTIAETVRYGPDNPTGGGCPETDTDPEGGIGGNEGPLSPGPPLPGGTKRTYHEAIEV